VRKHCDGTWYFCSCSTVNIALYGSKTGRPRRFAKPRIKSPWKSGDEFILFIVSNTNYRCSIQFVRCRFCNDMSLWDNCSCLNEIDVTETIANQKGNVMDECRADPPHQTEIKSFLAVLVNVGVWWRSGEARTNYRGPVILFVSFSVVSFLSIV